MTMSEIKEAVRWLREGCKFMCGKVDIAVCCIHGIYMILIGVEQTQEVVDREPFGHPIITDLMRAQWCSKGKADVQTFKKLCTMKQIPDSIIILVVTAVRLISAKVVPKCTNISYCESQAENAITEWSTGEYIPIQFSEEVCSRRYITFYIKDLTFNIL
jgi:hypothetical protein